MAAKLTEEPAPKGGKEGGVGGRGEKASRSDVSPACLGYLSVPRPKLGLLPAQCLGSPHFFRPVRLA